MEYRPPKPRVVVSNPAGRTKFQKIPPVARSPVKAVESTPRQTKRGFDNAAQRRRSPAGRPAGRGAQRRVIPPDPLSARRGTHFAPATTRTAAAGPGAAAPPGRPARRRRVPAPARETAKNRPSKPRPDPP